MNKIQLCFLIVAISVVASCDKPKQITEVAERRSFSSDWDSLSSNDRQPEWFQDAKLGIYFHWGVYSVPAFDSEWYPRWMYLSNLGDNWGGKVYDYHKNTFGPVSEFNYHDFVPLFDGKKFDAKDWAMLFESTGATFAGPVAIHHDGFAMWDSDVNPWNVADRGPKKDITGLLFKELKARNIKTIATFHHARLLQRYAETPSEWAEQGRGDVGWDSHYPYHPDFITSTTDPVLRKLYGNIPEDEFLEYWLAQVNEVVEKYSPDIIWFDSWLDKIPTEYQQKMVAHHFNHAVSNHQEPLVAYKQEDLPASVGILDIEQGGKTDISEDYWLTDITISHGSWCYTHDMGYKDPALMIRNMIDVWSKKGTVLLNVSPRSDGVIPKEQRDILHTIGTWINEHKQAVYATRVFDIYGYGAAEFEAGHFGGQSATMAYTNNDIRFTRSKDGGSIFIYILGLPKENSSLNIKHVVEHSKNIKRVSVVGSQTAVDWHINDQSELVITTPIKELMNEIATVFKVEFH